ncbi:MAG: NUDIX domain-containing protein [Eubacteriales bacterium]|nr:NUDIX domain-containing protein [Eubacteriales bacterium]
MNKGDYHLVVQVWIVNSDDEYLLSQRSPNKGFPLKWEPTGGSAVAGEDSLTSALREVKEELGIDLNPANGKLYKSFFRDAPNWENPDFLDVWMFRHDCPIEDVTLQEGETCDAIWASPETVKKMRDSGSLVPISYLDDFINVTYDRL